MCNWQLEQLLFHTALCSFNVEMAKAEESGYKYIICMQASSFEEQLFPLYIALLLFWFIVLPRKIWG